MNRAADLPPRRLLLGLVGLVTLAVAASGVGGSSILPVSALVKAAGRDYWLVASVAVVGVVVGLAAVLSGRERTLTQSETPDPERPIRVSAPGDRFETRVSDWRFVLPVVGADVRAEVRERLHAAAVATVARVENTPRAEARAAVTDGSWTTDPEASAYLRESEGHLWNWQERRRARRTAAVVVEYSRENGGIER